MISIYGQIKDGLIIPNNKKEVFEMEGKEVQVKIERKTGIRSDTQNAALHRYFELLAQALNDGGYNVQLVLKQVVDINWTKDLVKELIWRPIQKSLTKKNSTTKLDKVMDIDLVYGHINRYMGEKFYIHVDFPHDDNRNVPAITSDNYPQNDLEPTIL